MRHCAVVLSPNGRVKPDLVLVNGKPEKHPEGAYYLEWREKGRRIRLSVGKDAQDAAARRQRKEAELHALNNGVTVVPDNGDEGHKTVANAVAQFLEETELTKKPKTLAAYITTLSYFREPVGRSRFAHSATVARSLRYGKHNALSETFPQ
jgi:integrase/recombinase XerD